MTVFNPRLLPFTYGNTHAEQLAELAYEALPPSNNDKTLPDFWTYGSPQEFVNNFGDLGAVVWCRRNTYHRLLIHGNQVLRIWTIDKNARAELCEGLANVLTSTGIKGITPHKAKHYTAWVSLRTEAEVKILMNTIKRMYGL